MVFHSDSLRMLGGNGETHTWLPHVWWRQLTQSHPTELVIIFSVFKCEDW